MNPPIPVPVVKFPKMCCGMPVYWVKTPTTTECRNPKCQK